MLRLARRLSPGWPDVAVALVDQQEIVAPETRQAIAALGWPVESVKADVLDWLGQPLEWATQCSSRREEALTSRSRLGLQELEPAHVGCYTALDLTRNDAVIANLFLHHFEDARLAELLRGIARIARVFIAVEPRRSRWALACSRQLWAIGCNRVTRHDAPVSVRAGFAGNELSRLWPTDGRWSLEERAAGCFSHLFIARLRE
jgi:hypothetical protein